MRPEEKLDNREKEIQVLYKKYGPLVLRRCRKLLKDEENALDAMQEVFIKLIQNPQYLKAKYVSSLLFRICTNICLNKIRDEKKYSNFQTDQLINQIACFDESEKELIQSNLLDFLFKNTKPSTRVIATLYHIDNLTYAEVAEETGLSVSGLRKRLRKFKEQLKQQEG